VKLPAALDARPGQSTIDFQIDSTKADDASDAVITAQAGGSSAQERITVRSTTDPLRVPGRQYTRPEEALRFQVTAAEPGAAITVGQLPAGARFDAITGTFEWVPNHSQLGDYDLAFAIGDGGRGVTRRVTVTIESGAPIISAVVNGASRSDKAVCSPGSVASVTGRWLGAVQSDAGATVLRINGAPAPVLYTSPTRVDFLCPDVIAGTQLEIVAETPYGLTAPARVRSQDITPGLFSLHGSGSGEGLVLHAGTSVPVAIRKVASSAVPAMPGDQLIAYATGIQGASQMKVIMGGVITSPLSVEPVSGTPGLFQLVLSTPAKIPVGRRITVSLEAQGLSGLSTSSNEVWITVEQAGVPEGVVWAK
jgi:uncharacterized protein (TIGR03437 family)